MKKLQDNLAARIAASVILTVSFLLTLLSTAGIVLLASYQAYNDGGAQLRTSYLHAAGVQEYYDHVEPVLIQNTGISIVMAQNKHKFRSLTYLAIAIVNVISTYLLVPYLGGFGAALCSGVSYIIGQGIIMNIYYYRVTGIDILLFWKNIFEMSAVPVAMLVIGLAVARYIDFGRSWGVLFAGIIVYTLLFSVGSYFVTFNAYEKDVVSGALKKVLRRAR